MSRDLCPNYVRQFVTQKIIKVDADAYAVTHLITTGAVDRAGDVVEPMGALLDNYVSNPVVLADHAYTIDKVIGRATDIQVGKDGIVATTEFRDTPLARDAFSLTVDGLGGWSIGFRPTKRHSVRAGKDAGCPVCKGRGSGTEYSQHFLEWELLEYSSVAIPMNQEIVNNAVARGLCSPERIRYFFTAEPEPSREDADPGPNVTVSATHPALKTIRLAESRLRMATLQAAIDEVAQELE